MPEISRFFGVIIAMYYKDHPPPHFHAKYEGQTGVFTIADLKLVEGNLPKRVISLVLEWAFEHRESLMEDWDLAVAKKIVDKSGAWFSLDGERLGQGRENTRQFLQENPEMLEKLEAKVKEAFQVPVSKK